MDKKIYIDFAEHDIYFGEQMFTLVNINLELKSALRTKYLFCRTLLYIMTVASSVENLEIVFRASAERVHSAPIYWRIIPFIKEAPTDQDCKWSPGK